LTETAGLRKAIHAFSNFEVYCVVVKEGLEIVCGYGLRGYLLSFNSDVFVAGFGKGRAEIIVLYVYG
jgi:hypothetical protein